MKLKNVSLMNIFMCLLVVLIHLTAEGIMVLEKSSSWYKILFFINTFIRFAVPCFVFLSGYKLYNRYKDEKIDLKKFYKSRFTKIVIPYFICYVIYFAYFLNKGWVEKQSFFMLLIFGTLSAQFYYIIFTIQLYLLFPLLKVLFDKDSFCTLAISLIITLFCNQFVDFVYMHLLFTAWILYFVFGMFIAKYQKESKLNKYFLVKATIFIASSLLVLYTQYNAQLKFISFEYYASLFIIYAVSACAFFFDIFKLIQKDESKIQDFLIKVFDSNTYYIFLYHVLFISIAKWDITNALEIRFWQKYLIIWLFTFGCILIFCLVRNAISKKVYINCKK